MFETSVEDLLSDWEGSFHTKQFCDLECSGEDLDNCIMTDTEGGGETDDGGEEDALPGAQLDNDALQLALPQIYWRPWL